MPFALSPVRRSLAAAGTSIVPITTSGFLLRTVLAALLGVTAACGTDTKSVQGGADVPDVGGSPFDIQVDSIDTGGETDTADTGPADTGSTDVVEDTEDIAQDTGPVCPGAAGCPCSSVDQCSSNFCIDTPKGQQCAAICTDSCPDASFKCATVSGNDPINICVPRFGKVCNPCSANAECQGPGNSGARCVDEGNGGAFCGTSCVNGGDCPSGYECNDVKDVAGQTSKQCVVKDGGACTCTEAAMKLELSTKCYNVAGDSKCEGKRTCKYGPNGTVDGGGLTACVSSAPGDEICDGKDNDCDGQTDEATCDDKNPCTDDVCGGKEGCKQTNNTSGCDADGSVCTEKDTCSNGKCIAGKSIVCDDNNVCTKDSCDPVAGCKYDNDDGKGCNADDTLCTPNDLCKSGACVAGAKKACASDDQCVEGKCQIQTGNCTYLSKTSQPCNDGNPCTSGDKCAGASGDQCLGSSDTNCDDKNPCTADSCDPGAGCTHSAVSAACDDGNACSLGDVCANGVCAGPKALACDDNNPCTNDGCDAASGCTHAGTSGNPCDDGNPCTTGDLCGNGQCNSGANVCGCTTDDQCAPKEDGNYCNGTLYCDKSAQPYNCKVNPLSIVTCDLSVNNQCQTNACDPSNGKCILSKKADTTPCDNDANACTPGDACFSGQCVAGAPVACNDGNACTDDSCDPKKGCIYTPNKAPCDSDGSACTQGDACVLGSCVPGKQVVCNDNEGCTKDACDPKTGACSNTPLTQSCSDNNVCTTGDACGTDATSGKYTCIAGKSSLCDDGNPCTTDLCDPGKGCSNVADNTLKAPCYDADPKTKDKGPCKAGVAQCGSDGKPGACIGEVVPANGDICDGIDNNCDGIVDPGCAPTAFTAHFSNASVSGSGPTYAARSVTGVSGVAGVQKGTGNYSVTPGFLVWLKAAFGL